MKLRWKILIGVGIFSLLAVVSGFVTMRLQPENQVEAYKKLLRAKGEKLTINEVQPPPVPAESNCVDAVEAAFRMIGSGGAYVPNTMKMIAPGKALVSWAQPEVRAYDFTNSWEDFSAAVAADQPAVERLRQVLVRPQLDFHLDYQKGFTMLLPHLAPMKRAAQKLSAATVADLHNGDTGAAATNICVLLALVRANQNEGTIISHLVRIAMTAIASAATWDYLQATNVTDAQLAMLQKSWEQMEFFHSAENSFLMERAITTMGIEKLRASHAEFSRLTGSGLLSPSPASSPSTVGVLGLDAMIKSTKLAVGEAMWRSSWSYTEELHLLQTHEVVFETLRAMQTNQLLKPDYDAMTARISSLGLTNAGEAFFRALEISDFREEFDANFVSGTISKSMRIEAARRVVIAAIALKRFQVKHGQWPETLGELVPEFFAAVPIDPFDGKPLRYHPNADGTYLLYCVGEDGVDDGGDPTLPASITSTVFYWQNNKARDWVWPQPATAAEIQFFYDHPPK